MIRNRISENSCDKNHFDKAAPDYNIALKNSGFNENVTYIQVYQSVKLKNSGFNENVTYI